jgi:hypothetical protein
MDLYNKKILLVIHQGNLGGAERQGLGISKILTTKYNCTVNVLVVHKSVLMNRTQGSHYFNFQI